MATQTLTGHVADAGNLEKLPPEIRKQIYTHLLVEPKTIAIKRYINPKAYKSREVARMNHHRKSDRNRKVYDRRRKAWVEAPPSTTSILLVNKVICREATPVFYGSNDFFFDNAGALQVSLLGLASRGNIFVAWKSMAMMAAASDTTLLGKLWIVL